MEWVADERRQALLDQLALEENLQPGQSGLRIFKERIDIRDSRIDTVDDRSDICPGGNRPDIGILNPIAKWQRIVDDLFFG